jgi:hypothetical protein
MIARESALDAAELCAKIAEGQDIEQLFASGY